jgi:hypothetical protein
MKLLKRVESIGIWTQKKRKYQHTYICGGCKKKISSLYSLRIKEITGFCKHCLPRPWFHGDGKHRRKPVVLRYYLNNKIDSAPSITMFAAKHKELGPNAKYHFADILNGKRLHYKGWLLASNRVKININKVQKIEQLLIKPALIGKF